MNSAKTTHPARFDHDAEIEQELHLTFPMLHPECLKCADTADRQLREANERIAKQHRIALILQSGMLPDSWEAPGLDVGVHYRAGNQEALIGGDFYDVVDLEDGSTALIVGDVCGNGLQAASQIAVVRHSLRYALYRHPSLAAAVIELNDILIRHALLKNFVTLFVAVFEPNSRVLRYVSCGHEPAFLVRNGKRPRVEVLLATGPVLGVTQNAIFDERWSTLRPGDGLAVYTDGLVECGPVRCELLNVANLVKFVHKHYAEGDADRLAYNLYAAAKAKAGEEFSDDVCILCARAVA